MTKLALLIGINYEGTSSELRGCINPYCLVQQRDKYPYRLAWSWKPEDIEQLNELRKQHVESVRAQDVSTNQDVPLAHIVNEL